jgi:hypothetical protein
LVVLLCILSNQSNAADLKTSSAGQPISSADINANFQALNNQTVQAGVDYVSFGNVAVVYGSAGVNQGAYDYSGSVSFTSVSFSTVPVVTLTLVADQYCSAPVITTVDSSGFSFTGSHAGSAASCNAVNYTAIGQIN